MQEFVRKLFTDHGFRQTFAADPEATMAGASLSERERLAVRKLSSHLMAASVAAVVLAPSAPSWD